MCCSMLCDASDGMLCVVYILVLILSNMCRVYVVVRCVYIVVCCVSRVICCREFIAALSCPLRDQCQTVQRARRGNWGDDGFALSLRAESRTPTMSDPRISRKPVRHALPRPSSQAPQHACCSNRHQAPPNGVGVCRVLLVYCYWSTIVI